MRALSFALVSPVLISIRAGMFIPSAARLPDCKISFAKARIGVTQIACNPEGTLFF